MSSVFENMLSFEWRVVYTCIATLVVNLPFGYLRGGLRKLSIGWFLAIHLPVPLVIAIRAFHSLELTWLLAPFLLGSFFIGQFLGIKIYQWKPYRLPNFNKNKINPR